MSEFNATLRNLDQDDEMPSAPNVWNAPIAIKIPNKESIMCLDSKPFVDEEVNLDKELAGPSSPPASPSRRSQTARSDNSSYSFATINII